MGANPSTRGCPHTFGRIVYFGGAGLNDIKPGEL